LNNFQFSINGKNTSLAEIGKWTEASIEQRNNAIVDVLLEIFAFNDEEITAVKNKKTHNQTNAADAKSRAAD
jgi:hypothetical protein